MEELERTRNKYVEDIAKYEMEYGIYTEMLEKVAAKLNGRELKVKELRDIIIETLQDEASKMANSILAQWIEEGYIVPVGEFPINVKCPHCSTTFPLQITKEFMARLVRGYGILKTPQLGPLPSIEIPRPPSPGSTTIKCPSCDWLIQITYERVIEELSKAVKRKQRAN
jgi:phage FluMu protein Com